MELLEIQDLKLFIYENDKLELILEELEMHHIKWHDNKSYITCGMPDGDNPQSTTIYNNESLNVVAYTRNIIDIYGCSDVISLVCFIKKCYFRQAIMWLSGIVGLESEYQLKNQDTSTGLVKKIKKLYEQHRELIEPLTPIPENTLLPYGRMGHIEFEQDNISIQTQYEFELGFDLQTDWSGFPRHRITIPIRDENGTLVGVKGRLPKNTYYGLKCIDKEREETEPKYIYLYPCAKSQILYGLYKTQPYIQEKNEIIICESEKGVMQLWDMGFKNAVGIGGHSLSSVQVKKILNLNVDIIIAYDKDVTEHEILLECEKLTNKNNIFYLLDKKGILKEKESPMDNPKNWEQLYSNKIQFIT